MSAPQGLVATARDCDLIRHSHVLPRDWTVKEPRPNRVRDCQPACTNFITNDAPDGTDLLDSPDNFEIAETLVTNADRGYVKRIADSDRTRRHQSPIDGI